MSGPERSELAGNLTQSPFSAALEPVGEALPEAFRVKFLHSKQHDYDIVLEGEMDTVWRRWRWLWPMFWLLAKGDIFFPETGEDIPVRLVISSHTDVHGRPYQSWQRTFRFPNGTVRRFNAVISYEVKHDRLIESSGPAGMVKVLSSIQFPSVDRMETIARSLKLGLWRLQIPLPRWLAGSGDVVEEAKDDDSMYVTLTLRHPLLGPIFGYKGLFHIARQPRPAHV